VRADWADEEKQKEKDRQWLEGQRQPQGRSQGRETVTYIMCFEPEPPFAPRTARELLQAFNDNHPQRVRTHHFRTRVVDERLVGYICVDRDGGKEAVVKMLEASDQLKLIKVHEASQQDLDRLYKMGQPSLSR